MVEGAVDFSTLRRFWQRLLEASGCEQWDKKELPAPLKMPILVDPILPILSIYGCWAFICGRFGGPSTSWLSTVSLFLLLFCTATSSIAEMHIPSPSQEVMAHRTPLWGCWVPGGCGIGRSSLGRASPGAPLGHESIGVHAVDDKHPAWPDIYYTTRITRFSVSKVTQEFCHQQ